jgi:DNA excision repair protein ERCC-2
MIQRRKQKENDDYTPEKKYAHTFEEGGYAFSISGRADGFFSDSIVIEEIKSTFDVDDLFHKLSAHPDHPYVWQLRTYGYFHFKETGEIPELNLHLVSSRSYRSQDLEIDLNIPEYEVWLARRLEELVQETKIKEKIYKHRLKVSESMSFPFASPRKGQRELIANIEENMIHGAHMLVQAPTGLGKTVGVMFPTLKEALSRGQKLIYVTPKNSQHSVAEEAVERLQEQGSAIRALTINAKSKVCMKTETLCNPGYCEFAKDYYKKVAEHDLINKLSKKKNLSAQVFKNMAEEFQVCPFELSVEAIERADVVIGDYNYAFSPYSLVGKLSEPLLEPNEMPNLVIDEAHNLPSRAQDYFSPSLSISDLEFLEKDFSRLTAHLNLRASSLTRKAKTLIQSYGKSGSSRRIDVDIDEFAELDASIRELVTEYLSDESDVVTRDPLLRLMNTWSDFVGALSFDGPEFFQTYQRQRFDEAVKVTCCDASTQLKSAYEKFKNVVAFSATLKPFKYYQELLGFDLETSKTVEFQSPFATENRQLMIIPQISTKFNDRTQSAIKIAEVIQRVMQVQHGKYIALFPSFEFMKMVDAHLKLQDIQVLKQEREMKQEIIQSYLYEMKESKERILMMGVQCGVFAEGVDFAGDMLIGAFIVGPALPNFDFEREQIKNYFHERFGKDQAFNYTYVYPAMAKAIQSAGRVIRSESDRGVIIMMDPRFLEQAYAESMPQGWFKESPKELVSTKILNDLENFWRKEVQP